METINNYFVENMLKSKEHEKDIKLLDFKINQKAVGDGNNVSSEVSRINVKYEIHGKVVKKTFFMKIPSSSPLYTILKQFGIYEKECNMYTVVLPEMYKFLAEEDYFSPKCYVSSDQKILILEDLKESGYKMVNRRNQLDFDHACAALKTLAKFHVLSIKVNELFSEIIDPVKKDGFYADGKNPMVEHGYVRFLNACKDIKEIESVYDKLEAFKDHILNAVISRIQPRENSINVLNHGDFWSNNMLFKYDNDDIQVKLVDFQMCRWCSPAIDIIFFIISSVRFEVFEKKSDELLQVYHDAFSGWLRKLNCQETYSFDELKRDFHHSYQYGVNVFASVLPLVMKKAVDWNLNESPKNKKNSFNIGELNKMFKEEKYIAAVTNWIQFYDKNDLI